MYIYIYIYIYIAIPYSVSRIRTEGKNFSICSFVIGQQLRELDCDWPADK